MFKSGHITAKRRAIAVRLLAFFVPVIPLAGSASAIAVEPPSPKLVTTAPGSLPTEPATSVTPAILGEAEPIEESIRESAPGREWPVLFSVTRPVLKQTKHPEFVIQIFANATCANPPIKTGTAGELEEPGITVSVGADFKTTVSAKQIDPSDSSHPSPCSNPIYYWEGNVPSEEDSSGEGGGQSGGGTSTGGGSGGGGGGGVGQGAGGSSSGTSVSNQTAGGGKPDAPHVHMSPAERSNDPTPLVAGSAPGADSVSIYASANCSGTPVAKGLASQLPSGFEVSVPENAATTFSAVAIAAQRSSCSSSVTYTEDSTAPHTRITMGPGVKTRRRKAVFRFKDVTEDPPGTTYRCKVNRRKWRQCSSPFRLKHLRPHRYILKIRATDLAGNVERKPVKRRFIVVRHRGV